MRLVKARPQLRILMQHDIGMQLVYGLCAALNAGRELPDSVRTHGLNMYVFSWALGVWRRCFYTGVMHLKADIHTGVRESKTRGALHSSLDSDTFMTDSTEADKGSRYDMPLACSVYVSAQSKAVT